MRGRYEDERKIGVLMGLGTQCRATTGEAHDYERRRSFHMPPPSSNISKHGVGDRCRDDMSMESGYVRRTSGTARLGRSGARRFIRTEIRRGVDDSLFDLDLFADFTDLHDRRRV